MKRIWLFLAVLAGIVGAFQPVEQAQNGWQGLWGPFGVFLGQIWAKKAYF